MGSTEKKATGQEPPRKLHQEFETATNFDLNNKTKKRKPSPFQIELEKFIKSQLDVVGSL